MRHPRFLLFSLLTFCFLGGLSAGEVVRQPLEPSAFASPPPLYAPETWWHWVDGNIATEGLTRDLEALKEQGIQRALIVDIGFGGPSFVSQPADTLSEPWLAAVKHAAREASKRNMHLGLSLGPGWSGAGGPWISPELSMKHVVWSDLYIEGGRAFRGRLGALPTYGNWARDLRVLAWSVAPLRDTGTTKVRSEGCEDELSALQDGNPHTFVEGPKNAGKRWRLIFTFDQKRTVERAYLYFNNGIWKGQQEITVMVSAGARVLGVRRYHQSELDLPVSFSFPAAELEQCCLEVSVPDESLFAAEQFSLREAELLAPSEEPRWRSELPDWSVQIVETPGPFAEVPPSGRAARNAIDPASVVDLTNRVVAGELVWTPPPGLWRVVRFGYASTGKKVRPAQPGGTGLETDKMSAEATERQLHAYVGRILEAAAEHRPVFDLLMADSWESGMQNWTDDFPEEFERRRGYPIDPYLPVLAGAVVGDMERTLRFLNDFRETIGELVIDRYYGRVREFAQKAGMSFAAEFGNAGPKLDAFRLARAVDLPMDEIWSDTRAGGLPPIPDGQLRPLLLASAAFLGGKPVVPCEAYTSLWADWRRTPGDFGYVGDLAFYLGMNRLVLHSTVHQPNEKKPGLTLQGFGQHFQRHNTWWPLAADWLRELSRKQYVLQNTEPVFDLLVYYGDTLPRADTSLSRYELPAWVRPLAIDHDALLHRITVDGNRLRLDGRGDYCALVLADNPQYPGGQPLHWTTLARLAELVRAGAVLVGQPSPHPPGLASWPAGETRFRNLRDALWGTGSKESGAPSVYGAGRIYVTRQLAPILSDLGCKSDWECAPVSASDLELKYSRRRDAEGEVYFVFNPNPHSAAFVCRMAAEADFEPVVWDPVTGRAAPCAAFSRQGGRLVVPVTVEGRQSAFIRLQPRRERAPYLNRIVVVPTDADPYSGAANTFWVPSQAGEWRAWSRAPKEVFATDEQGRTASVVFPPARTLVPRLSLAVRFDLLPMLGSQKLPALEAWDKSPDERIRTYSGGARYEVEFEMPADFLAEQGAVVLDLGEVGRVARLTVNDQLVGTRWAPPFRFEVGQAVRPGKNRLVVEVANTWLNHLLADTERPASERTSWTTWPRLAQWVSQGAGPERSGWLGPLTLSSFPLVSPRFAKP